MRRSVLKPSRGTVIPAAIRSEVLDRDGHVCVGPLVGMPGQCERFLSLDHIRASGALGKKSPSTVENLVSLCRFHHDLKTNEGRKWRPELLGYVEFMASRVPA